MTYDNYYGTKYIKIMAHTGLAEPNRPSRTKFQCLNKLEFQRTHTCVPCVRWCMSMHFQSTARAALTGLQLLVLCTAHACLASLSSLTEAEPEIPSAAYIYMYIKITMNKCESL